MTETVIKVKNAYIEIEIHGSDLIMRDHIDENNMPVFTLKKGIPEILKYLKEEFSEGTKIN